MFQTATGGGSAHMHRILVRAGRTHRERFEREIRATAIRTHSFSASASLNKKRASLFAAITEAGADTWACLSRVTRASVLVPTFGLRSLAPTFALSRLFLIRSRFAWAFLLLASIVAVAALGLIGKGYVQNPPEFWRARLADRMVSPIYDADRTLIGAADTQSKLPPGQEYDYAYIPARDVPEVYRAAIVYLENRHLTEGGWHNVCGIDLASLARVITLRGGGSGLAQQLAFNLKAPDWQRGTGLSKISRALEQFGAACRLYQTLGSNESVIRTYAAYAPVWAGRGTLHGIEAASQVTWDKPAKMISPAQQIILAAAVKRPLRVVPDESRAIVCGTVWPKKNNPDYDGQIAAAHGARRDQCAVIGRAKFAAKNVLSGTAQWQALNELGRYERESIVPLNPFDNVDPKQLINLSTRTMATAPEGVLERIKVEAKRQDHEPGTPLIVSVQADVQNQFLHNVEQALSEIQASTTGRQTLCMPLLSKSPAMHNRACGNALKDELASAHANILAVQVDARTGAMKKAYVNSPLLYTQNISIGSLAKLIVLVAAVANGETPETRVCPKRANHANGLPLRRTEAPRLGYADCDGGAHTISLRDAIATSDNLAFYELAKQVGDAHLMGAARALGFASDDPIPAYAMAFGTYAGTPNEVLRAGQRIFGAAYSIEITGEAPRILLAKQRRRSTRALASLIDTADKQKSLKTLLEAPVMLRNGTAFFLQDTGAIAGKTGTLESPLRDSAGKKLGYGKFVLLYKHGEINLFMAASPRASLPFSTPNINHSLFKKVDSYLIQTDGRS